MSNINDLNSHIEEIEKQLLETPEYNAIEKMLTDAKGVLLKDIIETHPEVIEYLLVDNLPILKKSLWKSYININMGLYNDLCIKYGALSSLIDKLDLDDTQWKKALNIFNNRFSVPFNMEITNLKSAIIGESVPQVRFYFNKQDEEVSVDRNELEELDTLSQGEKRALYLLNIIFDVERIKSSGKETLLIVDDIADSFDYKNKYAIIEYLYDMSCEPNMYMIVLTHNYDFFRTVNSRLGVDYDNQFIAKNKEKGIELVLKESYKEPFEKWKRQPNEKNILALIPFVRNLVDYSYDRNISGTNGDSLFLTSLLHEKDDSGRITYRDLIPVYKEYIGIDAFKGDVILNYGIINRLYFVADSLTSEDDELSDKIVLSMAIRHKAEEYMISKINDYSGIINYKKNALKPEEFLKVIANHNNQTRELFNGFSQIGEKEAISILNEVNIITPEHIHLNSFMYEPLIDLDIIELRELYKKVKEL